MVSINNKTRLRNKGFTLIEMLAVVGVFAIVTVAISEIFLSIFNIYKKTNASRIVSQDVRYVLETISRDARAAKSIYINHKSNSPANQVRIISQNGKEILFWCENCATGSSSGVVKIKIDAVDQSLTSQSSNITKFEISDTEVVNECSAFQPFFKLLVEAETKEVDSKGNKQKVSLSTLISQRNYNSGQIPTITIGTQTWMRCNMNVGIQLATGATNPSNNGIIEKWCPAPHNTASSIDNLQYAANCDIYGALYRWDEAMQYSTVERAQGICPSGFHIPTHNEWTTLERAICTSGTCATDFPYDNTTTGWRGTDEGSKLKFGGSSWFGAYIPGFRYGGTTPGTFYNIDIRSWYWSSSPVVIPPTAETLIWTRDLDLSDANKQVRRNNSPHQTNGFPVRCLKD